MCDLMIGCARNFAYYTAIVCLLLHSGKVINYNLTTSEMLTHKLSLNIVILRFCLFYFLGKT